MSRQLASRFFEAVEPVAPNAIQLAANNFAGDPRSATHDDPRERKISLSQGMLYNNKPRDQTDLDGEPMNRVVGELFDMGGVRYALKSFGEYLAGHPNHTAYGNPKDPILNEVEPLIREVAFGASSPAVTGKVVATIPLVSQVDALREALRFFKKTRESLDTAVLSTNGYSPHQSVMKDFFGPDNVFLFNLTRPDGGFNFEGLEETLRSRVRSPENTIIFLQASGQNFLGVNPDEGQIRAMVELFDELRVLPFIDMAYQGLIGGLEQDALIPRLIANETDLPLVLFDSWSKKGKLYGLRVDFLHIVAGTAEQATTLRGNFHARIRDKILAMPPFFKVPYFLLSHDAAREYWLERDIPEAREILLSTRRQLSEGLGDEFRSLGQRRGMFAGFPITHEGIDVLAREYHIYAVKSRDQDMLDEQGAPVECARILAAIAQDALDHVASALLDIHSRYPSRGRHALAGS
jgi:aromatic-amino-acid transaminase